MSLKTRPPAVAGQFYPKDPKTLRADIKKYLAQARPSAATTPKALIVPHAGYIYSGPVAASAYRTLQGRKGITRVVLLGPAHRVGFSGLAAPSAAFFATPLGNIPIDQKSLEKIAGLPQVLTLDQAHEEEHSLEVQLPFLQELLGDFVLVPLAVGDAEASEVGAVLEALWEGPENLVVISSDLSHYHDYETARRLDEQTSQSILGLNGLNPEAACGRNPINGLLYVARKKNLRVQQVDLRNSGDTAGDKKRVVGYGAYLVS